MSRKRENATPSAPAWLAAWVVGFATLAALLAAPGAAARPASPLWPLLESYRWEELRDRGRQVVDELAVLYRATPEAEERLKIARAFYALGWESDAAEEALLADAESGHEGLRLQVQWALGRVSADDRVVDRLLSTLTDADESPLLRDKAACALASDQIHLSEEQRVRLLGRVIALLEAPDPWLRYEAIRVLEVQTGQRKGFIHFAPDEQRAAAVERWKRWLDEYRAQL